MIGVVMRTLFVVMMMLVAGSAQVQADEYREKIKELLKATQMSAGMSYWSKFSIEKEKEQTQQRFIETYAQRGVTLTSEQLETLMDNWKSTFALTLEDSMLDLIEPEYKEDFTIEELDELITIHKSPTYWKYAGKSMRVAQKIFKSGSELDEKVLEKAFKRTLKSAQVQ